MSKLVVIMLEDNYTLTGENKNAELARLLEQCGFVPHLFNGTDRSTGRTEAMTSSDLLTRVKEIVAKGDPVGLMFDDSVNGIADFGTEAMKAVRSSDVNVVASMLYTVHAGGPSQNDVPMPELTSGDSLIVNRSINSNRAVIGLWVRFAKKNGYDLNAVADEFIL